MRRVIRYLGAAMVALLLLAGCRGVIVIHDPALGGSEEGEVTILTVTNTGISAASASAAAFTAAIPGATFSAAADQMLTITFTGGEVDVTSLTGGGLTVYALTDAAAAGEVRVRGAAITPAVEVFPDGTGGSYAVLTMDLSAASARIELVLDGTVVTANGGAIFLNLDGDKVGGEAGEDSAIVYFNVTGGAPAPTGVDRLLGPAITVTLPAFASEIAAGASFNRGGVTNAAGGTGSMTAASLAGGIVFYRYSGGAWVQASVTPTYNDATGVLTFTHADTFAAGSMYKVVVDQYSVAESAAVQGYVHRLAYDQHTHANRYATSYFRVGALAGYTSGYQELGLAFAADTDIALPAIDTYDFRVDGAGGTTYSIDTTAVDATFADVVALMDAAVTADGYTVEIVENDPPGDYDIRVTNTATGAASTVDVVGGGGAGTNLLGGSGLNTTPDTAVAGEDPSVTVTKGGDEYARWVEVELNAGTKIKASSVSNDSIRIRNNTDDEWVGWSAFVMMSNLKLHLLMPATFKGGTTATQYQLFVYPSLLDEGATTDAADDVPFGDPSNADGAINGGTWSGGTSWGP